MWIQKPPHLLKLKTPKLDEPVELGDGEKVQVTKEVGELLIEEYDTITEN